MVDDSKIDLIADPVQKLACKSCGAHLDVSALESFSIIECPECQTRQPVPAQLGDFLLLEPLGMGGMGAVYKALDQSLGRYVAIKVMRKAFGEDKKFVESFLREARAAAAINHRNVVQIYSFGEEKGQPYIVMELVDGGKLDEIISDGNMIDEVRAMEIATDVAEGLRAANDISLVHGDIKPANILFDQEGTAKVADFGLAQFANWEHQGEVWGTPYYIAPEKARGQKTDHRSDIYSLGATLYHVLGAKPPFDGKTATDVVLARLKNAAIGLRVIRPSLQPETADLIARMLEADPFMRYPTYNSLLADVREALRVARLEQRSIHAKVKKSNALPVLVIGGVLLAAIAILSTSLWWVKKKQDGQGQTRQAIRITNLDQLRDPSAISKEPPPDVEEAPVAPLIVEEEQEPVELVVQPFSSEFQKSLTEATRSLEIGKARKMESNLQKLYDQRPKADIGKYWIRLFQAVACIADDRGADARSYLQVIANADFPAVSDTKPHPGMMPKSIALFMLGQVDDGKLYFEAARWPEWYADLTLFFLGTDKMKDRDYDAATKQLREYVEKKVSKPSWPYIFQSAADRWLREMTEWSDVRDGVNSLIADKKAAEAERMLRDFKRQSSGMFAPIVDRALSQVEEAKSIEKEEQRVADLLEHHEEVQHDLDLLDEIRTANAQYITARDFRKASAALTKVMRDMKTPEGNRSLIILRESYQRMDDLKDFLIRSIKSTPYREGHEHIVDANMTGIELALGSHGAMRKPWEQISVRKFLKISTHYISTPSIAKDERAEKYISLAVFCYANGGFKSASIYAKEAVDLDPDATGKILQLMPDIIEN